VHIIYGCAADISYSLLAVLECVTQAAHPAGAPEGSFCDESIAFVQYSDSTHPLPATAQLHGWIAGSMATLLNTAPGCAALLPPSAAVFFQHPSIVHSSSLQRKLNEQATDSLHQASLQHARNQRKTDGALAIAHLTAVSAPRAWTWKTVLPISRELELTDTQYRLAARLNLGLQPADGVRLGALPDICPLCAHVRVSYKSLRADPWHFLTCSKLMKGEISTRHHEVAEQVRRCAMMLSIRVQREVTGLDSDASLRPDLLLSMPGRTVLSDVVVCHPLGPGSRDSVGARALGMAKAKEGLKMRKYLALSARHSFVQLPIALESMGGMGPATVTLVQAMADASAEHLAMWSRESVIRQIVGALAMAVQRGNAMTFLDGYDRALHAAIAQAAESTKRRPKAAEEEGEEEMKEESIATTDEEEEDSEAE
jgi:hypothetical protein